nr:surface carbohydrate biosynthesis protein [uncultured Pseudodesulfovibrio sp.]
MEIATRELDGMLYFALNLASRGYPVLLGERMVNQYVKSTTAPICYFDSDQHQPTNKKILENGGIVFNLNAEGLSLIGSPDQLIDNYTKVAPYTTKLCMWGEEQTQLISSHLPEDQQSKVIPTGYPSFDLLKKEFVPLYKDKSITDEYGENFILINTNFYFYNHKMGFKNYIKMLSSMDEWKCYGEEGLQDYLENINTYQKDLLNEFNSMVKHIAEALPDHTIIIRPHPVENATVYEQEFSTLKNIFVTNKGGVRNWIASAKAVIHHDCTTGIEAMLLSIPVIQFRPIFDESITSQLSGKIGHQTVTAEEVLKTLNNCDSITESTRQTQTISPYLHTIQNDSASILADLVQTNCPHDHTWLPEPLGLWGDIKCWRKHLSKLIRAHQPGRNGQKVRYALDKFPRLTRSMVLNRMAEIQNIRPNLPQVDVTELCLNTFLIQPA